MTRPMFDESNLDGHRSSLDNVTEMFRIANDLLGKDCSSRDGWVASMKTR